LVAAGKFRHKDHRFEWTRAQLESWATRVAAQFGYGARFSEVGADDAATACPTQMAVFERAGEAAPGWTCSRCPSSPSAGGEMPWARVPAHRLRAGVRRAPEPRTAARPRVVDQALALREFALGIEGLERFVRGEPLRRVHECVFGVLALESEPVDPRL
jgi:hypothetical protein